MDRSVYLELDSFFLPRTPIPIYSERGPQVFARTFNPPVYHPSYPTRDEVRKSNYYRRQEQIQSQGFYTPNTKPYKEIGGPLVLDPRQLTILSLTQPSGKVPGGLSILSQFALGSDFAANEIDAQLQKRGSDRTVAKEDGHSVGDSEESNEQRLRLYRLKHQGEVMDVKKEAKAIQLMSRFASNGLPLMQLLNRVDDFRRMAKHGASVQVTASQSARPNTQEGGRISTTTLEENSPTQLNNIVDDDSSSDESDTVSQSANTSSTVVLKKQQADQPRPYSAAHYRIGSQVPDVGACEHLYRQLCALCWLLDAIANTDPSYTICPIVQSWTLQALNNMKVLTQESPQQKFTAIDSNWSSFLSHHHSSHGNNANTGVTGVKRSNMKQGGSKYGGSNAESRRTGHGATGGVALSVVTSEGLNESLDLGLGNLEGALTDRVPPTIVETPLSTNVGQNALQSYATGSEIQQQSGNADSTVVGGADATSTIVATPAPPVQHSLSVQLPPSGDDRTVSKDDDQRSKSSSQVRYYSAQSRAKVSGSALNRSSVSASGQRKPALNYRRLMRDREFLTAKLHEVEVDIEREERFRSYRRTSSRSATASSSNNNETGDMSDSARGSGISRDILEFTSRATSAKYHSLAHRSQHRFKTTAEEQALIVSDTLHQMDSRRMELFRLKFQSLEASSGCASSVTSRATSVSKSSTASTPRRPPAAETFDKATRRLRAKTAAAERQRRMAVEQANEERQRDWLGALKSFLPPQLLEDWRCRKILERLERHMSLRPNQTTDLNRFLDTLKTLRAFEICDPDVAAAVEFCRERILRFPVSEFEDFFKKHFPTVVRPEKPVQKKKRQHRNLLTL